MSMETSLFPPSSPVVTANHHLQLAVWFLLDARTAVRSMNVLHNRSTRTVRGHAKWSLLISYTSHYLVCSAVQTSIVEFRFLSSVPFRSRYAEDMPPIFPSLSQRIRAPAIILNAPPSALPQSFAREAALVGFDVDFDMLGVVLDAEAASAWIAEAEVVGMAKVDASDVGKARESRPVVIKKPLSS